MYAIRADGNLSRIARSAGVAMTASPTQLGCTTRILEGSVITPRSIAGRDDWGEMRRIVNCPVSVAGSDHPLLSRRTDRGWRIDSVAAIDHPRSSRLRYLLSVD